MTYTIWSNCGKFEWIIRDGEGIIGRSGLIYNNRATAKRNMMKSDVYIKAAKAEADREALDDFNYVGSRHHY